MPVGHPRGITPSPANRVLRLIAVAGIVLARPSAVQAGDAVMVPTTNVVIGAPSRVESRPGRPGQVPAFVFPLVTREGCGRIEVETLRVDAKAQDESPLSGRYRLELPPSLEPRRKAYGLDVESALTKVADWFTHVGYRVTPRDLIRRVVVFDDSSAARRAIAQEFGTGEVDVPATCYGTVAGDTLYVVSRPQFRAGWAKLYPGWAWTDDTYRGLLVHEIAHRAHEWIALSRFGSADAMGPPWFFEALALSCADQFACPAQTTPFLSWGEIERLAGIGVGRPSLRYPQLRQVMRSLTASFPMRFLIDRARRPDFVEMIRRDYLPSRFLLEPPTSGEPKGTILMVHGSAPFDVDGRIPAAGLADRYAREPFYRDLAAAFRAAGFAVLRYAKPGVTPEGIDRDVYSTTDLGVLSRQLGNLWRFIPSRLPRVVFAWSEGSLHLRALPLSRVDAVIVLGGIATNIGDIIAWQGGPSPAGMRRALASRDRREMLGPDRPVGRLLDELALGENWRVLERHGRAPALFLHGSADREVDPGQARVWGERLSSRGDVTVVLGDGLDHRFMPEGRYEPARPAAEVLAWLCDVLGPERGGPKATSPLPEVGGGRRTRGARRPP